MATGLFLGGWVLLLASTAGWFTSCVTVEVLIGDLNGLERAELVLSSRLRLAGWDEMDMMQLY